MSFPEWLQHYGLFAVLLATVLEGETVLVLAGFAAQQGHMDLAAVVAVAFVGGTLGDQCFFWFGRASGPRVLQRWPRLGVAAQRISVLMKRHDALLVFSIRFMYGLRIAGPIAIGALGVDPRRFALFNMFGAAVWAPLVAGAGYLSGHALDALLGDLEHFEMFAIAAIAACAVVVALAHRRRRSREGTGSDG